MKEECVYSIFRIGGGVVVVVVVVVVEFPPKCCYLSVGIHVVTFGRLHSQLF
jgi:hypothetical protein